MINLELHLPQGENFQRAVVKGRSTDSHGNLIGEYNSNPLLSTVLYNVELSDGVVGKYSANMIAENIYQQVDANGYNSAMVDSIVDYHRDDAAI